MRDDEGLDDLADEFEDRFGALPEAAATCLTIARIGVLACNAEIARIDAGPAAIALTPRPGRTLAGAGELVEKGGRYLLAERINDPHGWSGCGRCWPHSTSSFALRRMIEVIATNELG